jgi:hypothetical protein
MKDLEIDQNFLQGVTEKLQSVFANMELLDFKTFDPKVNAGASNGGAFGSLAAHLGGIGIAGGAAGGVTAGIAGALGITAAVVNPILGAVVLFLPQIIGFISKLFGGGNQQTNQKDAVRSKFVGEVFPQIKRKIRDELPSHLQEQIQGMIEQVRLQYAEKIEEQKVSIIASIEEKKANIAQAAQKQKALEDARTEIKNTTNTVMGWA